MQDNYIVRIHTVDTPRILPEGYTAIGTCGRCGGPIISPMVWGSGNTFDPPPEWCMDCGATPKKEIYPNWGPIKEMRE